MQNIGKADPYYPGRIQSDALCNVVLTASSEQHFNIPALATVAVFAATSNFYVLVNGQTAVVPTVTDTSFPSPNTDPELNPTVLGVTAGNLMSLISPAACVVTVSFYRETDKS